MRRFARWWRAQKPVPKAMYAVGAATVAAALAAAVIGAVLQVTLPRALFDDESAATRPLTAPAIVPQPSPTPTPTPTFTPTPTPTPSPSVTPSSWPPSDPPETGELVWLYDTGALENGNGRGAWTMGGELYEKSVGKYCTNTDFGTPSVQVWSTAGWTTLTAVVGIPDDEGDGLGALGRVHIRDQDGTDLIDPFDVALGDEREVTVDLDGAVQTQITCAGRDRENGDGRGFDIMLGDAALRR